MIDLHNHLLPDWDDGAADATESLRMLEVARADGISKIVLTPHVFRMTRPNRDTKELKARMGQFLHETRPPGIELFPGAEVSYRSDMIAAIKDLGLTVNGTNYVFIEFPALNLPEDTADFVIRMMRGDLIPIISHPERNAAFAGSPEILQELVGQGAISQVTALSLTGGFGRRVRKTAEDLLRRGLVHVIASDAHNSGSRPPRLSEAVESAARIVGTAKAEAMVTTVPEAILANEQVPE
ncbi:MAG: tyrosine-protein phosphatase [Candidatus Aminicenantales bacterium]